MDAQQLEAADVELDDEHAKLVADYVAALRQAFAALEPWWAKLAARHRRKALRLRWPCGVASHPRVLAIIRAYDRRLAELRAPSTEPGPSFDDDAAWGSEVELPPEALIAAPPRRLLRDRLQLEAPELYAELIYLLPWPVGEGQLPEALAAPPRMQALAPTGPRLDEPPSFEWGGRHGVERGVRRLLGAGIDLRGAGDYATASWADAGEAHRLAFEAYERDLELALATATAWWKAEIAKRRGLGLDADEAVAATWRAHPIGPSCHVAISAVVRGYWALCHEINDALVDGATRIGPELLLLAWLRDGRHPSWVEALSALPYWPVGLDAQGRWS